MTDARRALPSVGSLLESEAARVLLATTPRELVVEAARQVVARARSDGSKSPASPEAWVDAIATEVASVSRPSLRRAINATGIVLHTNLGRAPLAAAALDAVARVGAGYSNLEFDLDAGTRGSRYVHCAALLRELTGAEDALVVNNCAAALVLALNTLAREKDVLLSRGELVEIGGSFRIHEMVARSGARLREVGATNRTHVVDYARAIDLHTGALLKVHRSNFAMHGFVADVEVAELAALAAPRGIPVIHDLGSGLLISLESLGLTGEPTAREALAAGARVVVMSGDKLLGGPQAGILLGDAASIAAMRSNPLARTYRVDKMTLAALGATLTLYRDPERAVREVPALALLGRPEEALAVLCERIAGALAAAGIEVAIVRTTTGVGAGAFPEARLPSVALALPGNAEDWARRLRAGDPAVVGRVTDGRMLLDVRAVSHADADLLIHSVIAAHA